MQLIKRAVALAVAAAVLAAALTGFAARSAVGLDAAAPAPTYLLLQPCTTCPA